MHALFMRIAAIFHDKMSQNLSWLFFSTWSLLFPSLILVVLPLALFITVVTQTQMCQYYWLIRFCFLGVRGWGELLTQGHTYFFIHLISPDVLAVGLMEGDNGKAGFTLFLTDFLCSFSCMEVNILILFPFLVSYLLLVTLIGL